MSRNDETAEEKIIVAKIGMLIKQPFFGNIATRLPIIKAKGQWCTTLSTTGRAIYYCEEFVDKLTIKELEFGLAHEILHVIFDHPKRFGDRDSDVWNIACDYCINGILVRDKIGHVPRAEVIRIYHDHKFDNMNSEEIYDIISQDVGKHSSSGAEIFDQHIPWDQIDPENPDRPVQSAAEQQKNTDELREIIITAHQACGSGDNISPEIRRLIHDLTSPKMNWREIIRQQIQSTIKFDYSFARPAKKGFHSGFVLPGMTFSESIDICVAVDTSCSTQKQAAEFLSEIRSIMDCYETFTIRIWCFDTAVHNDQLFTEATRDDLTNYELIGGGGTKFMVNWDYMKQNNIIPKKFIMFTDGEPYGSWGDPDYADTVFVIHNKEKIVAPFGISCYYNEH